jgi:hypothetical protein
MFNALVLTRVLTGYAGRGGGGGGEIGPVSGGGVLGVL